MHDYAVSQRENNMWNLSKREVAEKAPRFARQRKGEKAAITHWLSRLERENLLQHFRRNTRNSRSVATRINVCPLPREASLNTGFPNPVPSIFTAEDMRACVERGDDKCTFVIQTGKICQHFKSTNCFPIFVIWIGERIFTFMGDTIISKIEQQSPDIWLLLGARVWPTQNDGFVVG